MLQNEQARWLPNSFILIKLGDNDYRCIEQKYIHHFELYNYPFEICISVLCK